MELRFLLTIIYKFKIAPRLALTSHLSQMNKRELFSPLCVCVCAMYVYIRVHAHTDRQTLPSQLVMQVFQGKSGRSRQHWTFN